MHESQRPHMPGYGIEPATSGGLLPWSWAEQRLLGSRSYWLATTWPDGRPHVMPVWAVWLDSALWFSCGPDSRKAKNLTTDPRCVLTTDNATEPVVCEGSASLCTDRDSIDRFARAAVAKYESVSDGDYDLDFYLANSTYVLRPRKVIALSEEDFTTSPTRWTFDG